MSKAIGTVTLVNEQSMFQKNGYAMDETQNNAIDNKRRGVINSM